MRDQVTMPPRRTPPLPLRVCVRSFPGRRDQVSNVRAIMASFLRGCPTADDAVLLVSELAANACAHSASGRPGGIFVVRAQVSGGGRVYAEVEDEGSPWDGTFSTAESPHGLYLLRALSTECGTRRGDRGWITWFVLDQQRPLSLPRRHRHRRKEPPVPMTSGVNAA
jgi:anti-sigma regulatory factor (Ser/Thr protein kinase)